MRPKARTAGLLVEELGGEAVVYDLDSDKVHRLDRRAFQVWQACDGQRTIAMIAQTISDAAGDTADRLALVEVAVDQLQEAGLLVAQQENEQGARRPPTRREMLTRTGSAGAFAGLAMIQTVTAPTPIMTASDTEPGPHDEDCRWKWQIPPKQGQWTCWGTNCRTKYNSNTGEFECRKR
jgi:hypothetical protein